jgi:hypothetical protein
MTLWGSTDYDSGNNKPKFANTTNVSSESSIHGEAANTNTFYGVVFGVSVEEAGTLEGGRIAHPGWVSQKIGTGPIIGIERSGGIGYNVGGYFVMTDASVLGSGAGANISYAIANSQNTLESYSSNAQLNVINSVTITNGGSGYSDSSNIALYTTSRGITNTTFTIVLGGRGDRKTYETLVAMRSISGDDPRDDATFGL